MFAALISSLLVASATIAATPRCSVKHPDRCRNTNQLVWSPGFDRAVRAFAGQSRTEHLYDGSLLNREMVEVLGGPPHDPVKWNGRYIFSACRAHSCDEKGAVVLTPTGQIEALAMIWYPCAGKWRSQSSCADRPRLTILARQPNNMPLMKRLEKWAREALAEYRDPRPVIGKTEVLRRP